MKPNRQLATVEETRGTREWTPPRPGRATSGAHVLFVHRGEQSSAILPLTLKAAALVAAPRVFGRRWQGFSKEGQRTFLDGLVRVFCRYGMLGPSIARGAVQPRIDGRRTSKLAVQLACALGDRPGEPPSRSAVAIARELTARLGLAEPSCGWDAFDTDEEDLA